VPSATPHRIGCQKLAGAHGNRIGGPHRARYTLMVSVPEIDLAFDPIKIGIYPGRKSTIRREAIEHGCWIAVQERHSRSINWTSKFCTRFWPPVDVK
jgi:hypothetical protein